MEGAAFDCCLSSDISSLIAAVVGVGFHMEQLINWILVVVCACGCVSVCRKELIVASDYIL